MAEEALAAVAAADGATLDVSADGVMLTYVSAAGALAPYVGTRLAIEGSLSGLAIRTGQMQHSDDTRCDPRVDAQVCDRVGMGSMVGVPLVYAGEAVGVLKLSSRARHGLATADRSVVHRLADFISCIVETAARVDAEVGRLLRHGVAGDARGRRGSMALPR